MATMATRIRGIILIRFERNLAHGFNPLIFSDRTRRPEESGAAGEVRLKRVLGGVGARRVWAVGPSEPCLELN
jgi:hypothetical protein